jgi:hypothetical protein
MNPEARQRLAHDARVIGIEQAGDFGVAACQRGEQQDAVGDAFRAGQLHRARRAAQRLEFERLH